MAEDHRGRGLLPRERPEEPQYPPPPGEEDDRRPYPPPPPPMSAGVTLPSIHDPYGPAGSSRYPPADPRADPRSRGQYSVSPTGVNGYGPPPQQGGTYLPPLHAPDQRQHYAGDGRDYYDRGPPPPQQQYDVGPPRRAPYGAPDPYHHPYNAYRAPPPGAPYGGYDYRGQAPPQPQAAPRQRTSIACRYCRKRKIRCSGYQNTPDGKCTNCKKTGNECVFQPVSSSSSTAFIPVSAVPGGVPPGTPLYGAFGQPLAPAQGSSAGPSQAPYPPSGNDYPLPSPTGSQGYYPHPDDRAQAGARRARPMDDEPGMRLPPPNPYPDEERDHHRRRSPVSMQSNTPPTGYQQYPARGGEYDDRTPTPRKNSPGNSSNTSNTGIMSLSNMMDQHAGSRPQASDAQRDIDRNMLGRLNHRRP